MCSSKQLLFLLLLHWGWVSCGCFCIVLNELDHSLAQGFSVLLSAPIILCDNPWGHVHSKNLVHHTKMKHLEVDLHFVRNQVHNGLIRALFVHSTDQLVDPLTKPLSNPSFQRMVPKLAGVSSPLTWRGYSSACTTPKPLLDHQPLFFGRRGLLHNITCTFGWDLLLSTCCTLGWVFFSYLGFKFTIHNILSFS